MSRGQTLLAVAGTLVAGTLGVLWLTRGDDGHAPLLWYLDFVSADARTVGVLHDEPHCMTKPGKARVREQAASVQITIPQVATGRSGPGGCSLVYLARVTRVRLARPLGARQLVQPAHGEGARHFLRQINWLKNSDCHRLLRVSADAPAQRVPWFARRQTRCSEPLPRGLVRLAFLRRSRSSADRLPRGTREELAISNFVTRAHETRGARDPARMWLVPGPRITCLYVRFTPATHEISSCKATPHVVRRGLMVARRCGGRPTRGPVRLAGVVPAGVHTVHILRARRIIETAQVRRGAWMTRNRNPDQVAYAGIRIRVRDPGPSPC